MPANLLQITRGTQKVLPVALERVNDGAIKVDQIKVTNFTGVKTKLVTSIIKSQEGKIAYSTAVNFLQLESPSTSIPSVTENNVLVRCSCKSFYFWFSESNRRSKSLYGRRFTPYVRKTPVSDPRYPPKNPGMVPGACKHVMHLTQSMKNLGALE